VFRNIVRGFTAETVERPTKLRWRQTPFINTSLVLLSGAIAADVSHDHARLQRDPFDRNVSLRSTPHRPRTRHARAQRR